MILSPSFQLPYADPAGYDIVSAQGLQVLAERAESVFAGFDARTALVRARPHVVWGLGSSSPAVSSGFENSIVWDSLIKDASGGGIIGNGDFHIDPAKLNPDCYVLAGWAGTLVPSGTANVGTARDWRIRVLDNSGATQVTVSAWSQRNYETGTGAEDNSIWMPLRLRPRQSVDFAYYHTNSSSAVAASAVSRCWVMYLGAAG